MEIMQVLNRFNRFNFCVESDKRRVRFSERSFREKTKAQRFRSEKKKTRKISIKGQLYGAGIAK